MRNPYCNKSENTYQEDKPWLPENWGMDERTGQGSRRLFYKKNKQTTGCQRVDSGQTGSSLARHAPEPVDSGCDRKQDDRQGRGCAREEHLVRCSIDTWVFGCESKLFGCVGSLREREIEVGRMSSKEVKLRR